MKTKEKEILLFGTLCIAAFVIWTLAVLNVDVKPLGVNGTNIGFSSLNCWFHQQTGVHMKLYSITDWLGLIPIAACVCFCIFGLAQWMKRHSIRKVDYDMILLGAYFIVVISGYLLFEMIPVNYRPVLINGMAEVSYPSSTTLLVLTVMPACIFQINRRVGNQSVRKILNTLIAAFSIFMVLGRLISGVHWLTDIVGAIILSTGMFSLYKGAVLMNDKRKRRQ